MMIYLDRNPLNNEEFLEAKAKGMDRRVDSHS